MGVNEIPAQADSEDRNLLYAQVFGQVLHPGNAVTTEAAQREEAAGINALKL